jgi:hypothetical protein
MIDGIGHSVVSVNKFERIKLIAAAEEKTIKGMAHNRIAAIVAARKTFKKLYCCTC